MKIKQHLVITDPIAFAKGDFSCCFSLFDHQSRVDKWIDAGEIELDVNVNTQHAVLLAKKELDEMESEIRANAQERLDRIDQARAELMAITHQPETAE